MKTMIADAGGKGGLRIEERPIPKPGPKQLLVRMRAFSLNYRDVDMLRGAHGALPPSFVPLSDGVGQVVEAGAEVSRFAAGDRVSPTFFPDWISGEANDEVRRRRLALPDDGVLSEYIVVDEHAAVRAPRNLSDVEAATLPCAGVTAWDALFVSGQVRPGDTVVVQGTGGVSLFAVLLAKLAGARVIVTSGQRAKLDRALGLGASHGIDHGAEGWHERVLGLTEGRGADQILDVAGGAGLSRSIAATRIGGTVSLIGYVAGRVAEFDVVVPIVRKTILRPIGVGSRSSFEALVRAVEVNDVHPVVDSVFPFARSHEALARLASGEAFGKVAIVFE
ncbi:NAD(P)-dependent alcohol dehydrogenase [Pendulispora albinea]|uniref:NAD(P)-dependent alcohol dehydrogenase n=1 Tax=Pendulispora albinea TaxID=2741071 RepID=A0ABZ2LN50_9BACT